MAILKIARMGHPVLAARAQEIADPGAPEVARLVEDMKETLADVGGIGLAAPQVHVPWRLVMFFVPGGRAEGADVPFTVLINPIVEPEGEERETGWEACLSIPEMMGAVPRWKKIRYRGVTPGGETVDRIAEGFHARVVQHECDHLDGMLYPRRIEDMSMFGFAEEMRRAHRAEAEEE